MWIDEIIESLPLGSIKSLQDDINHANFVINRTYRPLHGDRLAQWIEYRDLLVGEMARRQAA